MVLCKKCAHAVNPLTTRCPRCAWGWPYYRSRRWRLRGPDIPGLRFGKRCRRCGERTHRQRTPFWLKPLRMLSGKRVSVRRCHGCRWHGIALHSSEPSHRPQVAG
jgi:hypothetical protein